MSSGICRHAALVRTDVSEECVPSSLIVFTLMMDATCSSETSIFTRDRRCHIPKDGILHCHSRENPKSYIALTGWAL
jgi:hypothetical protein